MLLQRRIAFRVCKKFLFRMCALVDYGMSYACFFGVWRLEWITCPSFVSLECTALTLHFAWEWIRFHWRHFIGDYGGQRRIRFPKQRVSSYWGKPKEALLFVQVYHHHINGRSWKRTLSFFGGYKITYQLIRCILPRMSMPGYLQCVTQETQD